MTAKGYVTVFVILIQLNVLYISNILWKFHSNRLNVSGDTLCWTHIPSIFRSPWNMLGTEVLFLRCLAAKVLSQCTGWSTRRSAFFLPYICILVTWNKHYAKTDQDESFPMFACMTPLLYEPRHEISNDVVCATSKERCIVTRSFYKIQPIQVL